MAALKLVEPALDVVPASVRAKTSGLGGAMQGGNPALGRVDKDFYETTPEPTIALIRWMKANGLGFEGVVWEPCCGRGAITRILEMHGIEVVSTDLIDRGFGLTGPEYDLLAAGALMGDGDVVTNPPFKHAAAMIDRVMAMRPRRFALLLKSTFWSAKNRTALFRRYPPAWELQLTWRVDFRGLKRPTMECSWFVWDAAGDGVMRKDLLERPALRRAV